MRRISFLMATILAVFFVWHINAEAKGKQLATTDNSVIALSTHSSNVQRHDLPLNLDIGLIELSSYDYAKCIESCDNQYSTCTKNADAEKIKYCSNQHDRCRKACLEHK